VAGVPLVHYLAVVVVAGSVAATSWPLDPTLLLAIGIGLGSLALALPAGAGRQGAFVIGVAALAAGHAASTRDAVLAPPLGRWFAAQGGTADRRTLSPLRVRGVIAEDAAHTDTGAVRLRLFVHDVNPGAGWVPAPGLVQAFVQGELAVAEYTEWTRGRHIDTTVLLRWPPVLNNPGGADPIRQRLSRGYVLAGSIKSAALVEVAAGAWWDEAAASLRRHVRQRVAGAFGDDRRVCAAGVTAILIGDRTGLDRDLTERLIAAGTYHVIAISGGNVALVTLIVVLALRRTLRSPRLVPAIALAVVATYGWIVGGDPSVTRAVTAAVIWLGAETLGLRAPPLHTFSLVTLIVVARDPLIVVMPGAWLSFGATLGILACAGRLAGWVVPAGTPAGHSRTGRLLRVAVGLGAATLAAELILLPVGAWTFQRVSVAGLLLNFVAVPAMAVVQVAGVILVAGSGIVPWVATAAASIAHCATVLIVSSAALVDWAPHLAWRVPPPHAVVVVGYYAALGVIITGRGPARLQRAARSVGAVLLLAIAIGPGAWWAQPPSGWLRVTFLDVGQGDAAVVQFPSGHVLVVDAGPSGESFDAGERIVTPALWALGVRHVDWVVFSHADLDHIGGVAAVATEFSAREIWEGIPVPRDQGRAGLQAAVNPDGIVWRQLRRGDRWTAGGAEVTVLHPPEPDWERQRVRNDDSVVLRVRYGPLEVLLPGDVGQDIERGLPIGDDDRRDIRVLKVAHHGSRTSTAAALLDSYRPWAAIVSAGRNNTFGHPAPDVIGRLAAAGATILRTDRDGAVLVETDGRSVWMRTWNGRSWRAVVVPPR
jgi:competence protein ComEC